VPVRALMFGGLAVTAACHALGLAMPSLRPPITVGAPTSVAVAGCLVLAAILVTRDQRWVRTLAGGLGLLMASTDVLSWTAGLPGLPAASPGVVGLLAIAAELSVVLLWVACAERRLNRDFRGLTVAAACLLTVALTPLGQGKPGSVAAAAVSPVSEHTHDHGTSGQPVAPVPPTATPADAPASLDEQLAAARGAAARWPTLAAAQADGWTLAETYVAGTGSHWMHYDDIDSVFDPAVPEMLLFGGDDPTAPLVGLTYYVIHRPPEGFAGSADVWHQHQDVCIGHSGPLFAGDGVGQCKARADWSWMLHAWVVPGWENPNGVFAMENPRV
jgi:hypothetical protein